ncbi:MAG: ferritin-like domain-containing protein [Actinomycetota bacterium]|nr:ferritin-like domain-containing protein [Actinomycetota bacterium]
MSPPPAIDLEDLSLAHGGGVLLKRALAGVAPGGRLAVRGRAPDLTVELRAWCRSRGHHFDPSGHIVTRGTADDARWAGSQRAGDEGSPAGNPSPTWGLAARGAQVEAGAPAFRFALDDKRSVWASGAAALYRQAVAEQWDPARAVRWEEPFELPPEVEAAVVQVMTYLVENENAALVVPARFLGQVHPHFREVVQVLAVQVADEARHVEVFTRRALLRGGTLGLSTAGGQASLLTLLEEPDYATAHFLLSVLGEGTFLSLLSFLERHGPDPVTRQVTRLALADEARHVAFGMGHLQEVVAADPGIRARLATAILRRHRALAHTAGLNEEVFDALVVLSAGSWEPSAIRAGWARVQELQAEMADGRRRRLVKLGFAQEQAAELAALHTRNFM